LLWLFLVLDLLLVVLLALGEELFPPIHDVDGAVGYDMCRSGRYIRLNVGRRSSMTIGRDGAIIRPGVVDGNRSVDGSDIIAASRLRSALAPSEQLLGVQEEP
jgi:hypothetical protein